MSEPQHTVKIFWKTDCPKCPAAKDVGAALEKDGAHIALHDIGTVDGLAEASFHSVMATPTVVLVDQNDVEVKAWRGEAPALEEVRALIAHAVGAHRES